LVWISGVVCAKLGLLLLFGRCWNFMTLTNKLRQVALRKGYQFCSFIRRSQKAMAEKKIFTEKADFVV